MFVTAYVLAEARDHLSNLHPFFGMTYLVCKKHRLPVGTTIDIEINKEEAKFLREHYKPNISSSFYFSPFKATSRGPWLVKKYPWSGSQSTRTRGDLAQAFIHQKRTSQWGWREDYIEVLKRKLQRDHTERIPAFWLAVWLFREKEWPKRTNAETIISYFYKIFEITAREKNILFDSSTPRGVLEPLLQETPLSYSDVQAIVGRPPDAVPEVGGTLRLLEIQGVGPSRRFVLEPGDRLTIITGDNGLGKSFLLDCAWWCLTGFWAENPALPRQGTTKDEPRIAFEISVPGRKAARKTAVRYNWQRQMWEPPGKRPTIPGLIVYARVDGSFAVWDPVRHAGFTDASRLPVFSGSDVINGLGTKIEGLLRDWVKWQHAPEGTLFETFKKVLERISPPDLGILKPGQPMRIPGDARDIPTLQHRYGTVPFTNESAGVKRIITLAYLLVWAWNEHKIASELAREEPQRRFVILIDEVEAHLHPRWQREILPGILDLTAILSTELEPQVIVATHSPFVLASVEGTFSEVTDKLYHLRLSKGGEAELLELPFVRFGRVDNWLTSDVFDLKEARSREAERALNLAKRIMRKADATAAEVREATVLLKRTLLSDDIFWRRWAYFAQTRGVQV